MIIDNSFLFDQIKCELKEKGSVSFYARATPGASKTKVVEVMDDESIKITISAPAEKGKANEKLISFIASEFDVNKSQVEIVSGKTARMKLIRISI